ncbi:MAG: hypothetical protein WCK98_04975 [bacterium]
MQKLKNKTQVTVSYDLGLIIKSLGYKYPVFDLNQSIEYLIARGSGDYLEEIGLTLEDLRDIEKSNNEIASGQSVKAKNMLEAIKKLKE